MRRHRLLYVPVALIAVSGVLTATAVAHVERSSYWPDPGADRDVRPAAGGKVPKVRSLASALERSAAGDTHVVCKPDSMSRLRSSIRSGRRGWTLRPSQPARRLSARQASRLLALNRRLAERCRFRHIQAAVFEAGNHDRVVVMPGTYYEEPSRRRPTNDPRCERYEETSESGEGAATYRYQVKCPNDQNVVYVQGRARTGDAVPNPPRANRRGLPDEGVCVRCNLQIEGSGVKPEDVLLELAQDKRAKLRGPSAPAKEVGFRADRADGFVIRNVTIAHAAEHGIYVHETDGYRLSTFKVFFNKEYGTLTFTSDHGLTEDCEGMGHGDSAVYPGAGPDTGEQSEEPRRRTNQAITRCDVHHNTLGYSGTMGNGTRVVNNHFYDNSTAIATDSFFAGGHPGYPQDSAVFERNRIYSNNFNSFTADSDVEPKVPVPVGVGILIAGGNGNRITGNHIYDNWRRGTMLFQVPDALSDEGATTANSVSHRNRYFKNRMGISPSGKRLPNGIDFWWDEAPAQEDNCWYDNGEVRTEPPAPLLPSSCENLSTGVTYGSKITELLGCAGAISGGGFDPNACVWFTTPPKPGAAAASKTGAPYLATRAATGVPGDQLADVLGGACELAGTSLSCSAFSGRP